MQIVGAQLNKERLNGNKLFLHTFKNFSTTSKRVSFKAHVVHALIFILSILSIIYVVLVISVIFNIINKKESLAEINNINFSIAKLEKEYNSSVATLTKDYAISYGYTQVNNNSFAKRKDAAASLSFLYEGNKN